MMSSTDKPKKLLSNTLIIGIGSIASKGILFLMAPLFSRWLSAEEYGSFDVIITYVSLLIPLCTLSIEEALFRFLLDDINESNKHEMISNGFILVFTGIGTFTILYSLFSAVIPGLNFNWLIVTLLFAQTINSFFCQIARGLKRLDIYSLFGVVSACVLSLFSTVLLLVCKLGVTGIVLGYSAGYILSAIGIAISTKSYSFISLKHLNVKTVKKMLAYSWPLIPNSISWWVVSVSDRIIINNYIGLAANGIYAVANKVPAIANIVFSIFHISWLQSASESVNDSDYNEYCNNTFNKLLSFSLTTAGILIGFNFVFFEYVFDTKYHDAYYYTPILVSAIILSALSQFIGGIMIAKKKTLGNGATNVVAALSNILINLFMVKRYGLYAAALSTVGSYLVLLILRVMCTRKYVKLELKKSNMLLMVYYIALMVMVYQNKAALNYAVLLASIIVFIISNKEIVKSLISTGLSLLKKLSKRTIR